MWWQPPTDCSRPGRASSSRTTIERAPLIAVLERGRIVQQGARTELAVAPGPFRDLLVASRTEHGHALPAGDGIDAKGVVAAELSEGEAALLGSAHVAGSKTITRASPFSITAPGCGS